MSYHQENLDRIVSHLREELTIGDWTVLTAKRIANSTGLGTREVGYWLGRINGTRDGFDPVHTPGLEVSKWNTGASTPVRWKVERVEATEQPQENTDSERLVVDGGVRWLDFREFQQQLVKGVIEFEHEHGRAPCGQELKELVEDHYADDINHGRLYPNLDVVVERGLIEKGEYDRRTNSYASTSLARQLVAGEAEHMAHLAGLELASAVADGGEER